MHRMMAFIATILCLAVNSLGQSAPIVKQVALTNQTAYISPTVLVTPKSNAVYRISAYFEVVSLDQNSCDYYYLNLGWSDASPSGQGRAKLTIFTSPTCDGRYSAQEVVVVSDLAGEPLGYSVTDTDGVPPSVPFNLYITVEQLQ
jgi:hypothetical protein